jgi:hypothetical protein
MKNYREELDYFKAAHIDKIIYKDKNIAEYYDREEYIKDSIATRQYNCYEIEIIMLYYNCLLCFTLYNINRNNINKISKRVSYITNFIEAINQLCRTYFKQRYFNYKASYKDYFKLFYYKCYYHFLHYKYFRQFKKLI